MTDPIFINSYMQICDFVYDFENKDDVPPSGIVYCPLDQIYHFFKICSQTKNKYILVSACSDFSLCYQTLNPVNADLSKKIFYIPFEKLTLEREYASININMCCESERCNIDDKFSIKCYSHTTSTFDQIPDNIIHWFATNADVREDKVTGIPFGVPSAKHIKWNLDKKQLLYVNFQLNTDVRSQLQDYFYDKPWATVVTDRVPFKQYLEDISNHKFVLSPHGNGIDCYRTWETLYAGSVPIVPPGRWCRYFRELPLYTMEYPTKITKELLNDIYESFCIKDWNLEKLSMNYWKNKIYEYRHLCQ